MYKQNPFSLLFGVKSENYLKRVNEFNEIVNSFENNLVFGCYSIISGIRGSGKTAMLTDLIEYYSNFEDWIIIELIPSMNLLEQLASKLIDKMNKIKNKYKLSFSFSFVGITFEITGKDKINDITLLIENLLLELKRKNIKVLIANDEIEKTIMLLHLFKLIKFYYENIY